VPLAHQALDQLGTQLQLRPSDLTGLHVAIEEHLTNIISYGYQPGQVGTIRIRMQTERSSVQVEIEDDARAFNPLAGPEVDTSLPLDEKPIGGLGIHLIRKSADQLSYARVHGRNVLRMMKHLELPAT
jgi:anti-sigma regulatory factor (Ser/Thr protein kinase)